MAKKKKEEVLDVKPEELVAEEIVEAVQETSAPQRSSHERQKDREDYLAAREQRQDDALTVGKYLSAQKRRNVLTGEISAVETLGGHVFWAVYDGPVTVLIPFEDALPSIPAESFQGGEDVAKRQRQLLSKSLGVDVPFSVESMTESEVPGTYLVYGSRKVALERIRNRYFGDRAVKPLSVGDDVEGTFLAVGAHAAWLNVAGVDVRLVPRQLSHRYMDDMQAFYKPGDKVTLRIQAIEMKDGVPVLRLSALPCELESCKMRTNRMRVGSRYKAVITSHRVIDRIDPKTKQKRAVYSAGLWLEGVNVPAYCTQTNAHSSGAAHSGDTVMVELIGVAENGYAHVRILAYLPY